MITELLTEYGGDPEEIEVELTSVQIHYAKGISFPEVHGPRATPSRTMVALFARPIESIIPRLAMMLNVYSTIRQVVVTVNLEYDECFRLVTALATRTNLIAVTLNSSKYRQENDARYELGAQIPTILEKNKALRLLTLNGDTFIFDFGSRQRFTDALAMHTGLRRLRIADGRLLLDDALCRVLSENRSIRDLARLAGGPETKKIKAAKRDNWALEHIRVQEWFHSCEPEFKWHRNFYYKFVHYIITMLPRRLPAYVVLWILDWIPPMNRRYRWRNDPAFDPHHGKKIALISGLMVSYRAIKG